jgi:anti-sigma regulatory factor (Ser/Thr protein kinase)
MRRAGKRTGRPPAAGGAEVGATAPGPTDRLFFHRGKAPRRGREILSLEIPSDLNLKYAYIVRLVEAVGAALPLSGEDRNKLELCLDEALKNAIVWGNGQDPAKKLRIAAWEEDGHWGFTVSDEGTGFRREAIPDYTSEDFAWRESGRGIFVLLNYLSEVHYYDGGSTILVRA